MTSNFQDYIGISPSGKATDFDSVIRRFESYYPCHISKVEGRCKCVNDLINLLDEIISTINEVLIPLEEFLNQIISIFEKFLIKSKRMQVMRHCLQQSRVYINKKRKNFVWYTSGFL